MLFKGYNVSNILDVIPVSLLKFLKGFVLTDMNESNQSRYLTYCEYDFFGRKKDPHIDLSKVSRIEISSSKVPNRISTLRITFMNRVDHPNNYVDSIFKNIFEIRMPFMSPSEFVQPSECIAFRNTNEYKSNHGFSVIKYFDLYKLLLYFKTKYKDSGVDVFTIERIGATHIRIGAMHINGLVRDYLSIVRNMDTETQCKDINALFDWCYCEEVKQAAVSYCADNDLTEMQMLVLNATRDKEHIKTDFRL